MTNTKADILWHPVRMRILMTLAGRQLTTQQIGTLLPDVAQATLYRHIRRLVNAEVMAVVDQQPVRGVMEKRYALAGNGFSINPDTHQMGQEDWVRAFAAFTATLVGQFEVYIRQENVNPVTDRISFRTAPLYLTDAETLQLFASIRALVVPAMERKPSPDRHRRLLSTILIPDVDFPDAGPVTDTGATEEGELK